tara:strand:- start:4162 stop:4386 length:225 start_codon:yes stop_codon:yes gene_type:complete
MGEFRVREATVEVCNGYRCWHERRFIAERKIKTWLFSFWWLVIDAEWRKTREDAVRDIIRHKNLCKPSEVTENG